MSGWYFVIFGLGSAVLWTFYETRKAKKWQKSLAESRTALTGDQFVDEMQKLGVDKATAKFLFDEINFYYFEPLQPDPTDRVYSTLSIDPFDVTDIAEKYWRDVHGLADPTGTVVVPDDPSLAELGLYLDGLISANSGPISSAN